MVVVRVGSHFGIIWRAFCGAISRSSSGNYEYEFCSSGNGEVRMVNAVSKVELRKKRHFLFFVAGGKKSFSQNDGEFLATPYPKNPLNFVGVKYRPFGDRLMGRN